MDPQFNPSVALLVIDMQRGLFAYPTPVYQEKQLVDNILSLVARAHQAGALVVYIQHSNQKLLPYGSPNWNLHPKLQPAPGDLRIDKQHGSAFQDTMLSSELTACPIKTLVITGLVTNQCVRATALHALKLGFHVVLVSDGHSSNHRQAAEIVSEWNRKMKDFGCELLPTALVDFDPQPAPHL